MFHTVNDVTQDTQSQNSQFDICEYQHVDTIISTEQFTKAILNIDTEISDSELKRYLQWIFRKDPDHKQTILSVLVKDLQNFNCFYHELIKTELDSKEETTKNTD